MVLTRRRMLAAAAAAGGIALLPRLLYRPATASASGKLNIACIGVGGRGAVNLGRMAGESVVALCDVDQSALDSAGKKFPAAKRFRDFRKMFDAMEKQIDAVVVSTPDHTHAVAAMAAIKRGKHVYCEKPLAHSIWEVRQLMEAARKNKVITQLGNQGHSFESIRMFCEWIRDGAIGNVHTIHAASGQVASRLDILEKVASEKIPVPNNLDWDLWLGPAPHRPYHPEYAPHKWRGWTAFGSGIIGDWLCHVVDPVFWALELGAPTSIVAQAEDYDPKKQGETFPRGVTVKYQFAATAKRPAVTLYWHDGSHKIPWPPGLEKGRTVPETGAVVLGEKAGITYGAHGARGVRIFPEEKMRAYKLPEATIQRVGDHGDHYANWLQAIRSNQPAGSDFSYGGPLTEIALLGVIAIRQLGQELKWDGAAGRFTNSIEANGCLQAGYRSGWVL